VRGEDGRQQRHARSNEHGGAVLEPPVDLLEPQRIGDDHLEGLEHVATTTHLREDELGTCAVHPQLALDLAQSLPHDHGAEQEAPAVPDPHLDDEIAPFDPVAREKASLDVDRPTSDPPPAAREQACQDESEPDDRERYRAESP
jgi:hypothetical protein